MTKDNLIDLRDSNEYYEKKVELCHIISPRRLITDINHINMLEVLPLISVALFLDNLEK